MSRICALTTIDNPCDPFEDYANWLIFDQTHSYHSCEVLAREAHTSDEMSEDENAYEIERAIIDIVSRDPTGMRTLVYKKDLGGTD